MAKHALMSSALAKALIDSGVKHFDIGGGVDTAFNPGGAVPGSSNVVSGSGGFNTGLTDLSGAFTPQSGYTAQLAPTADTDYSGLISGAGSNAFGGYGTAQGIQAQQQALANQLLAQSKGGGPNPAQAALAQNTGSNVATQAALMASQRGTNQNAGLLAREAAQQGASTQQNAVGQAATLQAQQSLAAQQALISQQSNMANQNIGEQQVNSNLLGISTGAQNSQNNTSVNNYAQAQGLNQSTAQNNATATNKNSPVGAIGNLLSSLSKGGKAGDHLRKMASVYHPDFMARAKDFRIGGPVPGKSKVKGNSEKNDVVPAMLSPGEEVLPRSVTQSKNAPSKAAEFVRSLQAKDGKKDKTSAPEKGSPKDLQSRVERLEKFFGAQAA